MQSLIFKKVSEIQCKAPLVLGLGVFDGFHLGHQLLLDEIQNYGKSNQLKTAIWSFLPHKAGQKIERIQTTHQCQRFLENKGFDFSFHSELFQEVMELSAEDFLTEILIKRLNARAIVLGREARLGKQRECSAQEFSVLASKKNVKVLLPSVLESDGEKVSSSYIREAIQKADFEQVSALLGRPYCFEGEVIQGEKRGRTLGYPTANLSLKGFVHPLPGVYAGSAILKGSRFKAISYIGVRPTLFGDECPQYLEVHIPNFDSDLYGQVLEFEFERQIRPEKSFENVDELKNQIEIDIQDLMNN